MYGTDLVGLAPLTIRRGSLGRIPVTRIDFAPNDSIAGEFLVRDNRSDVLPALLDSLVRTVKFDVICLNGFDPASTKLQALLAFARWRRLSTETEDHACAVVDLREGYDSYWATRNGNTRRKISQRARKIDAMGATVDGVLPSETRRDIDARIDRMIAINEASYKLQGQRLAAHHRGFLTDLSRRFAARDMLSIPILSIGGRDAAFILGIVERGCFYDVTLAYDDTFAALGPGIYLMQRTLRVLSDAKIHTVISHGAHEYKRQWATAFVPQTRVFLFPGRPVAVAARLVRFGLLRRVTARAASGEVDPGIDDRNVEGRTADHISRTT
jgi:CelD/BcsL family acetyltransferase involved in cellulose biosynthesis